MAHGVPGVIALLGASIGDGVELPGARSLLRDAVAWLFGRALPEAQQTVIPNYVVGDGTPATDGRSGWCYGDPGAAAAVLVAARATGDDAWEREAIRWMRKCAARPMQDAGVRDAGLCHGAAGLAHVFNRVYQATGIEELGAAARRWFARTLELRREGEGVAGFPAYVGAGPAAGCWQARAGLLSGATGVAMALLAATTAVEPSWDRALLLDVPLASKRHVLVRARASSDS
jgi:hypothetical protein